MTSTICKLFHYDYFAPEDEKALRAYKYSGSNKSLFYKHLYSPICG